ncbi:MAG: DUF4886 domain-containing protein [Bacteroidales bacterium]|nr:DUF4886 domain-containing protein [Bacteroidales bacterium]
MPGILNAAGLNGIQMVHMYYGGRTIPEYNSGWATATDYHCYLCNPGQTSWTDLAGKSLAQVAVSVPFDIVTIQEHTGRQLAWGWTADEKSAVQGLIQKVKDAQASVAGAPKLYYILSQAYHGLGKAQSVAKPFTNTTEMWEVLAAQGQKVMTECDFDGIISTGVMLQNLRTSGLNNEMGLTRDGYHMDYGLARYGASCAVFETVIGPFNGNVTLDENSYRYSSTAAGTTAVTDDSAPIALKAAVEFSATGAANAGVVVGTANSCTVENVHLSGTIVSTGTSVSNARFALGGITGFAFSTVGSEILDCVIKDCTVNMTVNAEGGSNTGNGATCAMYGGIAGFCTNVKDDSRIRITNCVNNGEMSVNLGRCSGIVATANYGTVMTSCTNNASQFNSIANGRIGQIVCNLSVQSGLVDCQNNGNLITTGNKTTTAGLVALMGDKTCYMEGCDRVANTGGNHEMFPITADNFMDYIGYVNGSYAAKITNMTYAEP